MHSRHLKFENVQYMNITRNGLFIAAWRLV